MKKIIALLFFLVVASAVIFWYMYPSLKKPKDERPAQTSSFEECAKAGYPILESYPRQCRDRSGNLFFETINEPTLK